MGIFVPYDHPTTAQGSLGVVGAPPPPPRPPKKAGGGRGGWRSQNRKFHWGIVLSPKMMILQGVKHPLSYVEVCYANDPQTEG